MHQCYLCKAEITKKNKSVEHIILNALGGRLKSSKIICKDCNSKLGSAMDASLAKQLEFFTNQLNIKRERGVVQNIEMLRKSTGEIYLVSPKGDLRLKKPLVKIKEFEKKANIQVKANNINEANKIFTGLKRKYSKLEKINICDIMKEVEERINEPLYGTVSFDGGEIYPAILKMAINYYVDKGGDIDSIALAIEDLKRKEINRVEMIFFDRPLVVANSEEDVLHCIFINGRKKERRLYAIIELFSTLQFIIKLSDAYLGEDVQFLYVFDVLKKEEIKTKMQFIPDSDFIFSFKYQGLERDNISFTQKMNRILQIGSKRRFNNIILEITMESLKAAFGEQNKRKITKDDVPILVNEIMKRISPFIV